MARKSADPFDSGVRRGQWLKGVLDLCVLALIGDDARYGYDLASEFEALGLGELKGGTLYPRLAAMERDGLLVAEWRPGSGGPGRKFYRSSEAGRSLLRDNSAHWQQFARAVSGLLAEDAVGREHRVDDERTTI